MLVRFDDHCSALTKLISCGRFSLPAYAFHNFYLKSQLLVVLHFHLVIYLHFSNYIVAQNPYFIFRGFPSIFFTPMRRCCLMPYVLSICAQSRCAPSIQCFKSILCITPDLVNVFHITSLKYFVQFDTSVFYRIDRIYFVLRYVNSNSIFYNFFLTCSPLLHYFP
jgi:hypothetical protein